VKPLYLIRPNADQDIEDQSFYLATKDGPDLGHRFLLAAHHTFTLLARHPSDGLAVQDALPGTR
jgi:plasmid stabilization system protein ParE